MGDMGSLLPVTALLSPAALLESRNVGRVVPPELSPIFLAFDVVPNVRLPYLVWMPLSVGSSEVGGLPEVSEEEPCRGFKEDGRWFCRVLAHVPTYVVVGLYNVAHRLTFTASEHVSDPSLPHIKDRTADFRSIAGTSLCSSRRGTRIAPPNGVCIEYSTFLCLSISIPKYVPRIDTVTHFLKVLIWILSFFRRQIWMRSLSVCVELAKCWSACEHHTKLQFEEAEKVCWH